MTPLLWLAVSAAGDRRVVDSAVPPVVMIGDVPSYVFDKHTAAGKAAIHRFARENASVRDGLAAFVPEYRALDVTRMAASMSTPPLYPVALNGQHRRSWSASGSRPT
jgi:hypothetical protein